MVTIRFDEETGILHLVYTESVDGEDIEAFIQYLIDHPELPSTLYVLHAVGNNRSSLKMMDLIRFSKEMKRGTSRFKSIRAAVCTTNSLTLTLSHLYERLNLEHNTRFKTFRSESSAVSWLLDI